MNPKISYLIALYNKEKFIKECIDSILIDLSGNYKIEICVVDDGSTDNSLSIVRQYYSTLSCVKIYSFPQNRGKVAAYNKAFELSTGDYISILGADDTIIKGRSQILLGLCQENNCIVYGSLLRYMDGTDPTKGSIYSPPSNPNYLDNLLGNSLSGGCFMAPLKSIKEIFPIPENLKFEDWWIANQSLKKENVKTTKHVVTYYRIHESNDCGAQNSTLESIQKDYKRHFIYLSELKKQSSSKDEELYIERALAIRKLVCGMSVSYRSLSRPPYNKSYLIMLSLFVFGPKIIDSKFRALAKKFI